MFVVSYVMIVAFHPTLKLERVIIYRSFAHTLDQLSNINYSTREQIGFIDNYLVHMLKDCAYEVSRRQCKNSLGQMFSVESALVKKTLLKWFNAKFKRTFTELRPITKLRFEAAKKINWQKDKCVICKFPMKLEPTNWQTPSSEMTYGDFVICFEHTFLGNIFSKEQLCSAEQIKTLEKYYEFFQKYIQICVGLLALLNSNQKENFINNEVENFIEEEFADDEICEIKNTIQKTEIKNVLSQSRGEVYKCNLKVYAFVYDKIIFLPRSDIKYDTLTTNKFFIHMNRLIKGKVHLHNSHITGTILGYSHDFCNTTVIEKTRSEIPFVVHNFFGFDIFYYLKTFIASAWCSKKLNIGGTNLTHVNYGIIDNEIKLIDSLKYYQKSLADLSSTLTQEEKRAAEKVTKQFFNQHYYFSTVWTYLPPKLQEKVLDIVTSGKGIIPYELIVDMQSLLLTPDNEQFWNKTEFFSELKLQAVDDDSNGNSKFLYKTLKMRNLGDLNDLYNTQDVILLCEILENRFQAMHNTYGFNPRKCNSASTMSGYIEREMSKVIITLPTKIKHVEIFEQTVIGGFSCVNNRLAFDTQLLLPNFVDSEMAVKKDFNYKIAYNLKIADNQKAKKRVITKILKLDENNQYGHGMTKSLPTGCIKDDPDLSWETFNLLLERGHLYIVDTELDTKNASEKILAYNEIYPPIIEKQKVIDPCERPTYQLLEQFVMGEKKPSSYKKIAKAQANLFTKLFLPMYLKDLAFCIKRAG